MDLISVIIPVYKVEKYLDRCVESVVNQTYKNLEIILVDDGSPDNCPKMCDEWAKKDKRIKVIHKENGGLSDARNAGINKMNGNLVMFLDSDDSIHYQTIEILLNNLKKNNADIATCSFQKVSSLEKIVEPTYDLKDIECEVYKDDDCYNQLFSAQISTNVMAWAKLYKSEIFKDLRYDKGKIHEDEFIIHKVFDKCKIIIYIDLPLYNYLQRESSITGSFSIKRLQRLEALENRIVYTCEHRPQFKKKAILQYMNIAIATYYKAKLAKFDKITLKEIREKVDGYYKQGYKTFKIMLFCRMPRILDLFVGLYAIIKNK